MSIEPKQIVLETNSTARVREKHQALKKLRQRLRDPRFALNIARKRLYFWRHPDDPWIVPGATRFLEQWLRPDWLLFEFGSGRSTAWFARRVRSVISIEQDGQWYERVAAMVVRRRVQQKVDLRHVPLDHPKEAPTLPYYASLPGYVAQASTVENRSVDVCLVDGHYRQACLQAILPKLKPGGLLVLDNSNWLAKALWGVPAAWALIGCFQFAGDETTIWRKPNSN